MAMLELSILYHPQKHLMLTLRNIMTKLPITSGPDTHDYKKSPVASFDQPQSDSAVLPSDHTQFEKRFPNPSLEMTLLFQCLQLQKETMNGSISSREGPAFSAVI